MKKIVLTLSLMCILMCFNSVGHAADSSDENILDDLDPSSPNIEETLDQLDSYYQENTGNLPWTLSAISNFQVGSGCVQLECHVYAQVVKSQQKMYLYIDGKLEKTWLVSTGLPGLETPLLNSHPNGRIYDAYTSTTHPGGDYNGLGNMPYAVFIYGGVAIHGTGRSNWHKLGTKASHGCIRIHPDNAQYFNRLVKETGINQVWVSVQD